MLTISLVTQAQVKKANLKASGLTCAMCSKAVYKSLTSVPFVDKVEADIEKSTYDISFKPGLSIDFDALSRAVVDAGFSVAVLKVTSSFTGVRIQKGSQVSVGNVPVQFIEAAEQTLNGDKTFTLIDKNFVSAKEFKMYSQKAGSAYKTGYAEGKRIYHAVL